MKTWRTLWLYHEPPAPRTALQIAVDDLQEARINLLDHAKKREHAQHMESMLRERIGRLQNDIVELSQENQEGRPL